MGDDERATIGKARTPASGVPVEVDPEGTPPPREPPNITELEGFDELPDAARRALLAMHNTQREQDVALVRLWGARKANEELAELRSDVNVALDRTAGIPQLSASVVSLGGLIVRLTTVTEEQSRRNAKLDLTLEGMDRRVDKIEADARVLSTEVHGIERRGEEGHGAAMKELEHTGGKVESLSHRVESLESTRTKLRGAFAVIAVLLTVIASIGGFLLHEAWAKLFGGSGAK